jgi:polyhydroxybutyrate depolymerase
MSYLLGCFHSSKIAAIAPLAGTMNSEQLGSCKPEHHLPVMVVHGDKDQLASYDGSFQGVGVEELVNYFVKINSCNTTASETLVADVTTADNCTVKRFVYENGNNGSKVELMKVIEGGHEWPSLTKTKNDYGVGNRNNDVNASLEIWKFLSKYKLNELGTVDYTSSINENTTKQNYSVIFPNPSDGLFSVYASEYEGAIIKIKNVLGNIVFEKTLTSKTTMINLTPSSSGIYMYSIITKQGNTYGGKILIR